MTARAGADRPLRQGGRDETTSDVRSSGRPGFRLAGHRLRRLVGRGRRRRGDGGGREGQERQREEGQEDRSPTGCARLRPLHARKRGRRARPQGVRRRHGAGGAGTRAGRARPGHRAAGRVRGGGQGLPAPDEGPHRRRGQWQGRRQGAGPGTEVRPVHAGERRQHPRPRLLPGWGVDEDRRGFQPELGGVPGRSESLGSLFGPSGGPGLAPRPGAGS